MSPASSRAQMRQRRNLLVSVLAVVVIAVGSFAAVFSVKWTPRLGLDLAGGLSVVYQTAKTVSPAELQETVAILDNRVNGLGVSGAQVSTAGNNEISVSIPGVKNAAALLAEIGNTAQLFFRPVLCTAYPLSLSPATKATQDNPGPAGPEAHFGQQDLAGLRGRLRHHAGQPGRHAQQLGAGLLVQQSRRPIRGSPSTRAPAPTSRTTRAAPCSSRACRQPARPRKARSATCSAPSR